MTREKHHASSNFDYCDSSRDRKDDLGTPIDSRSHIRLQRLRSKKSRNASSQQYRRAGITNRCVCACVRVCLCNPTHALSLPSLVVECNLAHTAAHWALKNWRIVRGEIPEEADSSHATSL